MNVERHAYHGKSLIGNHVHTCCKITQILPLEQEFVESQNSIELLHFFWQEDNIAKLCSAVVTKTEELCPSFLSQAREISVKFEQVFKLFSACYFVYDSAEYFINERLISQVSERKNLTFMENMNTVMRSCLKSTSSCFLVAEEDIADFLQFLREKFPDMTRYDNMLEEHVCHFL